ncbi:MAG TPA: hypothetical protein PLM52_04140 [Tabrizicola sp.]|nr:hypothetical protein [Tabrizicola sp.]
MPRAATAPDLLLRPDIPSLPVAAALLLALILRLRGKGKVVTQSAADRN